MAKMKMKNTFCLTCLALVEFANLEMFYSPELRCKLSKKYFEKKSVFVQISIRQSSDMDKWR